MEYVSPPPVQPPGPGNLLAAADTPSEALRRGVIEVGYRARACGGWGLFADVACGEDLVTEDYDANPGADIVRGVPFGIETVEECSTMGTSREELTARALARLTAVESAAIAREFWTGELATAAADGDADSPWNLNVRLADTGAVTDHTPGAGTVDLVSGLALLEQAIGVELAGAPAVVHCTRQTATHLAEPAALRTEGNLVLTPLGTRVVADAGYPGTGPDGEAPDDGEAWLYATARPTIRRSDTWTVPGDETGVNRANNLRTVTAQRLAVVLLACGIHAVRVHLTTPAEPAE